MTDVAVKGILGQFKLVPVVIVDDPQTGKQLGQALVDGGLPLAEVTFRTAGAADSLTAMAAIDDLIVGAGTVISAGQVDIAVRAGAQFIVSPGLSESVIGRAQELNVPVLPGVSSATDIMRALDLGCDVVKFFPAEASGGTAAIKALSAPFPQVTFVPTGGVTAESAARYLALPSVAAVGGSWMVPADVVRSGDFATITELTSEAVQAATAAVRRGQD